MTTTLNKQEEIYKVQIVFMLIGTSCTFRDWCRLLPGTCTASRVPPPHLEQKEKLPVRELRPPGDPEEAPPPEHN